ncbi:MAG: glycosyltransferase family 2 protein [Patescibacteria group bacterium]
MKKLSLIIIAYNMKDLVSKQINHLYNIKTNIDYEIIVVDNGSSDNIIDIKPKFPNVKFVISKNNLGYFGGANLGAKNSNGEYLFILNSDILASDYCFDKLIDFIENNKNVGIVAPKLIYPDERGIQNSCFRFHNILTPLMRRTALGETKFGIFENKKMLMDDFDHEDTIECDWVLGAAFIIKKSFLEEIGGFDERYFLYYEDMDICKTTWANNKKVVYLHTTHMIHNHARSSAKNKNFFDFIKNKKLKIHITSSVKYFFKFLFKY